MLTTCVAPTPSPSNRSCRLSRTPACISAASAVSTGSTRTCFSLRSAWLRPLTSTVSFLALPPPSSKHILFQALSHMMGSPSCRPPCSTRNDTSAASYGCWAIRHHRQSRPPRSHSNSRHAMPGISPRSGEASCDRPPWFVTAACRMLDRNCKSFRTRIRPCLSSCLPRPATRRSQTLRLCMNFSRRKPWSPRIAQTS